MVDGTMLGIFIDNHRQFQSIFDLLHTWTALLFIIILILPCLHFIRLGANNLAFIHFRRFIFVFNWLLVIFFLIFCLFAKIYFGVFSVIAAIYSVSFWGFIDKADMFLFFLLILDRNRIEIVQILLLSVYPLCYIFNWMLIYVLSLFSGVDSFPNLAHLFLYFGKTPLIYCSVFLICVPGSILALQVRWQPSR